MELEPTKKPVYSYFIGWKDGTGEIGTHIEVMPKVNGIKDYTEFDVVDEMFDSWTEINPTKANLKTLKLFCDCLTEELGGGVK